MTCYEGRRFVAQKYLELHYQEIHIGDLAASTTLIEKPQLAGSLQPCLKLFHNLANAICICNLCKNLPVNNDKQNYVCVPEPTYIHSVYLKALHNLGVPIIEPNLYYKKFDIISASQAYSNPWIARPPVGSSQPFEKIQVENHLNKRLLNSELYYMRMWGQNNNLSSEIKDIYGKIVVLSERNLNTVIFLHSFEEGQYFYGLDGFDDLFHWTIFTIDHCLRNSSIDLILVKPHPAIDPDKSNICDKISF